MAQIKSLQSQTVKTASAVDEVVRLCKPDQLAIGADSAEIEAAVTDATNEEKGSDLALQPVLLRLHDQQFGARGHRVTCFDQALPWPNNVPCSAPIARSRHRGVRPARAHVPCAAPTNTALSVFGESSRFDSDTRHNWCMRCSCGGQWVGSKPSWYCRVVVGTLGRI